MHNSNRTPTTLSAASPRAFRVISLVPLRSLLIAFSDPLARGRHVTPGPSNTPQTQFLCFFLHPATQPARAHKPASLALPATSPEPLLSVADPCSLLCSSSVGIPEIASVRLCVPDHPQSEVRVTRAREAFSGRPRWPRSHPSRRGSACECPQAQRPPSASFLPLPVFQTFCEPA
jgi:hypothetical protein